MFTHLRRERHESNPMIPLQLADFFASRQATVLGVGPVSRICIDAAVDLANEHRVPMFLIATRRQVETPEICRGYTELGDTEGFVQYVRARDRGQFVICARDHGGPWQHPSEVTPPMTLERAMASAKQSMQADIEAGVTMIHIDASIQPDASVSPHQLLDRTLELYEFCHLTAEKARRKVFFEVGHDPPDVDEDDPERFESTLGMVLAACHRLRLPKPLFVVAHTGTKVMETRNIGTFGKSIANGTRGVSVVKRLVAICQRHGVWLKEHNADYLDDAELRGHPSLGIHAANVAPEFGVTETRALLSMLLRRGLRREYDEFIGLSLKSDAWRKWMLPNSQANDVDRAEISGHYLFATSEFKELRFRIAESLPMGADGLDAGLYVAVKRAIHRYLSHFNCL